MWTIGIPGAPDGRGVRGAPGGKATRTARSSGGKRPSMNSRAGCTLAWSGSASAVRR